MKIVRLSSLALIAFAGASLSACNLVKQPEPEYEAPEGTTVVPVDQARDVPLDEAGQPKDKGEGPVLQALGSLSGVDLGPRQGGCTFQHQDGRDLFITGAAASEGVIARGAVRTEGVIVNLASQDEIGIEGLKAGPVLTDGKIFVQVRRAAGPGEVKGGVTQWNANLGVSDLEGNQRIYSPGRWVCA
ncbi:MAG TPA: hypothetical protein VLA37_08310 [Sphingomonadaceae bacterium]|nr:hypothetical protein [Sphingomonadaceae bacterium]